MNDYIVPDTETVRRIYANSMDPRGFDEWLERRDAEIRSEHHQPEFKKIAQKRFRHEGMCVCDRQTGTIALIRDTKLAARLTRELNSGYLDVTELQWVEDPENPSGRS